MNTTTLEKPSGATKLYTVSRGRPPPLGATPDSGGVNFSLFSESATGLELLLFADASAPQPFQVIDFDATENKTFRFWHLYVEKLPPGTLYAYRVDGPSNLDAGMRFDKEKVLLDPYCKGVSHSRWDRVRACQSGDNVESGLRGVVIDVDDYDWEGDRPLCRPMEASIIYEMHVGGFTRSPSAKSKHPGTFQGVVEKIPYLKELGITAVELLPVFDFDHQEVLREGPQGRPLTNYWGYSTISFFAPHNGYCQNPHMGGHLNEFRDMVKALHQAGIEVILDVVFNHTNEGNENGPTINFRGIDNATYYDLEPYNKRYYSNYSGCGNTITFGTSPSP